MKKIFIVFLAYSLLAAVGFIGGFFLTEFYFSQVDKNKPASSSLSQQNSENIPDDEAQVVIATPEEVETGESPDPEPAVIADEPKKEAKFSFAILGDTQYFKPGAAGGYASAAASLKKINPNLIFAVGDLVSSCDKTSECEEKLNDWKGVLGSLIFKTYVMQGNHDRTGREKADAAWEKAFSHLPANGPEGFSRFAYSLDWENSHFVVLASDKPEENDINKTQLDWLEKDLARNKKENVFVFFHEPAYPTNSKIGESLDESPQNRDRLWSILESHKVKGVFSGHEHIQSRRKVGGIYQFGFGNTEAFDHLAPKPGMAEYFHVGQAFGLVEIEGTKITVKTYSVGGKVLNSFEIPN